MNMTNFETAVTYSLIAFSIVFIVLGGLTFVIYAMRLLTGEETPKAPPLPSASAVTTAPAVKAVEIPPVSPSAVINVKVQHVAAITAAILAATQGMGRVLRITPIESARPFSTGVNSTWRAAAVVDSVNRGLEPSWKR
ncbi:MAG: OadG family protein [Synergistaceae bacterium]|jgi:Na+-transporting methylmalonyl-CoA/oxaloacetate decarboxylase gamma subunit|nr:OadG family protein [Synergistaceae bacterium]